MTEIKEIQRRRCIFAVLGIEFAAAVKRHTAVNLVLGSADGGQVGGGVEIGNAVIHTYTADLGFLLVGNILQTEILADKPDVHRLLLLSELCKLESHSGQSP